MSEVKGGDAAVVGISAVVESTGAVGVSVIETGGFVSDGTVAASLVSVAASAGGVEEVKESCKWSRSDVCSAGLNDPPSLEVVVFEKTNRLISLFRNRGLSISSCAGVGTAAAKPRAGSRADKTASEAAKMTVDLRIMVDTRSIIGEEIFVTRLDRTRICS